MLLAIAASQDAIAESRAALEAQIPALGGAIRGSWLYALGKAEVAGPIRSRNLEGLGDDWLNLRNVALRGAIPGAGAGAARAFFADGCVALALADLWPKLEGAEAVLVVSPDDQPVRLEVAQFGEASLARLAAAYISGDVWGLAGMRWPEVLSAIDAVAGDTP